MGNQQKNAGKSRKFYRSIKDNLPIFLTKYRERFSVSKLTCCSIEYFFSYMRTIRPDMGEIESDSLKHRVYSGISHDVISFLRLPI